MYVTVKSRAGAGKNAAHMLIMFTATNRADEGHAFSLHPLPLSQTLSIDRYKEKLKVTPKPQIQCT